QALTYASAGEREAAARLIAEARRLLDTGGDNAWRNGLQAEVDLVEAWNADAATAPAALDAAARAVEYFSSADARAAFRLREALIARARVLRLADALDEACANLDRVLEILATER